jgi:methionine-rich copper-binding protein CopC
MNMSAKKLLAMAALLASCAVSPMVLAHAHLLNQVPAANSQVATPAQLQLVFSEGIEVVFSKVSLTDAQGREVPMDALSAAPGDKKTLLIRPAAQLVPGQYKVSWDVRSVDTHKSSGTYSFTVGK